jgi:sulfatase maturation enzyme AslB (radical SAM superfamily)
LVNAGIDQVYISFWGIKKDEYERTMGLDYDKVLKNIENFAKVFSNKMSLTITWIKSKKIQSTPSDIQEFWDKKGILVENEDTLPWNRAGYLTDEVFSQLFKEFPTISYEKKIWCSQLFFTDTISWNGDIVLCSQDYFEKKCVLGNINNVSVRQIAEMKRDILQKKTKIDLCERCRKPSHNYGFASAPWDKILSLEEKSKYWYQ